MADQKFFRTADAVIGDLDVDGDTYGLVLEAVERGYNLRAIEELEVD